MNVRNFKVIEIKQAKEHKLDFINYLLSVPILPYGSEILVLAKRTESRLQATEMEFRSATGCSLQVCVA
jgi:hypothetical protein